MHRAWPRLTIRRLMGAVAVFGVVLGLGLAFYRMRQVRAFCHDRSYGCRSARGPCELQLKWHLGLKAGLEQALGFAEAEPKSPDQELAVMRAAIIEEDRHIVQSRRLVAYWTELAAKYHHLADQPWLPIPPDPPPP